MLGRIHIGRFIPSVLLLAILATPAHAADPLPSWNDTATKTAIVEFVTAVTSKDGPTFVQPGNRHAISRPGPESPSTPDCITVFSL